MVASVSLLSLPDDPTLTRLDRRHAITKTVLTMVNLNSVGRSFYVLSNILLGIKHKKGNEKVHQGKKSLFNKYLIPTMLRQRLTITMFDISLCWQSPQSATQPSSSVCRMVAVSRRPGPATERRTVWMPAMRGTVRQVMLTSNFPSQNNNETFSQSLRLLRAGFQAVCKLYIYTLMIHE